LIHSVQRKFKSARLLLSLVKAFLLSDPISTMCETILRPPGSGGTGVVVTGVYSWIAFRRPGSEFGAVN
jgi:hypothetical protein